MWPLVFAGLFYAWNLQASLRLAHGAARDSGSYPALGHVLGNLCLLATVTGVAFVRADGSRLAAPWWLLAATLGLTVGHIMAIAWLDRLATTRRERSGA